MTRKKAIAIVVDTIEGCSWYPADWIMAGTNNFPSAYANGKYGRGAAVGFATKICGEGFLEKGYRKRTDGGWDFTRTWLEKNGHL